YNALRSTATAVTNGTDPTTHVPYTNYTGNYGFIKADAAITDVQPPTVNLDLNPTTINLGDSATLTWTASNADSCTASGDWSGNEPFSGNLKVTPTATGSLTYTLTCENNGGLNTALETQVLTVVSGGGGGGGGGGALDVVALLALGGLTGVQLRRRRR